jgi:hypothetical protein
MLMITAERRAAVRNVRELSLMRSAQVQVAPAAIASTRNEKEN